MSRPMGWYVARLRQMSPAEVAQRTLDEGRHLAWSRQQVRPGHEVGAPRGVRELRRLATPLGPEVREAISPAARDRVVAAADRLLDGEWTLLGTPRPDVVDPDWFLDPVTGRRAPQRRLAFHVDHRDEAVTGNVKAVWELSRHHHLTVLAAAWWLTGDERYAEVVDTQLRSWWQANPFLSGVHWTSGIELGIRLTSWVWVRRLLDEWPKVGDLFETNDVALRQVWWHQRFLAAYPSRGSSGNNHAVAEASGLLATACAFPWFAQSDRWGAMGLRRLQRSLAHNTFDSGVNRELASDYHRFVTELGVFAAVEAAAAGHPVADETWTRLAASLDAAAAMVDVRGRPPRQGDGDEGRAVVLDDPDADPWAELLGLGDAVVGAADWWPDHEQGLAAVAAASLLPVPPRVAGRPAEAPRSFPDAGLHLLRTEPRDGPEIWVRCDGGPHGFLSIAAHAHADALSLEVRHDGVDVLADPGTYCYHGEPRWRSYFRSTLAHNTVEVDGVPQSVEDGPFLWSDHASTRLLETSVGDQPVQHWSAQHFGYTRLDPALRHVRTVCLEKVLREVSVFDVLTSSRPHTVRLPFHLGPGVEAVLSGTSADLRWHGEHGTVHATLHLPHQLTWSAHHGDTDPVLGWYSPRFGHKVPTTTLLGVGTAAATVELRTTLVFLDGARGARATNGGGHHG